MSSISQGLPPLPEAQDAIAQLVEAMETVLTISDRKHDAWDAAKAAIAAYRAAQASESAAVPEDSAKPLPLSTSSYFEPMFTVDQMREYGDARAAHARRVAMDEAAKFIENGSFLHDQAPGKLFANQVAPLIRSMK